MNHLKITNYKKRSSSLQWPYNKWPTGRSMQKWVKH